MRFSVSVSAIAGFFRTDHDPPLVGELECAAA